MFILKMVYTVFLPLSLSRHLFILWCIQSAMSCWSRLDWDGMRCLEFLYILSCQPACNIHCHCLNLCLYNSFQFYFIFLVLFYIYIYFLVICFTSKKVGKKWRGTTKNYVWTCAKISCLFVTCLLPCYSLVLFV